MQDKARATHNATHIPDPAPEAFSQMTSLYSSEFDQLLGLSGAPVPSNCYWPTEIVDSMARSAQFFNTGSTTQTQAAYSRPQSDQEQEQ